MGKSTKVASRNDMVELKENRNLFARLLVVSRSGDDLNFEATVGNYELSVVPRPLFCADGKMLHCQQKSQLLAILKALPQAN